jgi:hypothetical protein
MTALSPIDNRYLSPVYVPGILIGVYLLSELKQEFSLFFGRQAVTIALLVGLSAWLIYPVGGTIKLVDRYLTYGVGGFQSTQWADSDLISYLKHNNLPGIVYTNEVEAIYALTGKVFRGAPRRYRYESTTPTNDLAKFEQALEVNDRVYLIMFHGDWWRDYLFDTEFYKSRYIVDEVVAGGDGEIYQVRLPASGQLSPLLDEIQTDHEKSDY